jgi:DNA-directed RNA polymerase specialized sigma24 family protein
LRQVRGINQQDAEDAVQDAWLVLAAKAPELEPGPVGGYLMRTARFKALKTRDRKARHSSLDAMKDAAGDGARELADGRATPMDVHIQLDELERDPVARRVLDAAAEGGAAQLAPRGMNHPCARYTDEQVACVRTLRAEGKTFVAIARQTGVPAGYASMLAKRHARVCPTAEGWTDVAILEALRRFRCRHDRSPRLRDMDGDPTMPSANTVARRFGSWQNALTTAGIAPTYGDHRMRAWSQEEMVLAFCSWRTRTRRWPTRRDMVNDASLPSPATTGRRFGTQSSAGVARVVLDLLA